MYSWVLSPQISWILDHLYIVLFFCCCCCCFVFYLFQHFHQEASRWSILSMSYWTLKREIEGGEEKELCRFVSEVASWEVYSLLWESNQFLPLLLENSFTLSLLQIYWHPWPYLADRPNLNIIHTFFRLYCQCEVID